LPLSLPPAVIVSHGALLLAVQLQPLPLVTPTVPVLAPAGAFALDWESENEQPLP
jgi:hypothetical protein